LNAQFPTAVQQKFVLNQSGAAGLTSFSIGGISWGFDKAQSETWAKTLMLY
jgi:hypothetical protein